MKELIKMTPQEWLEKGKTLFGDDMLKWKFKCPSCGHIQSAEDFRAFKNNGATPEHVRFNCIGRFNGKGGEIFNGKSPCNYTAGGFFKISPIEITLEDGKKTSSFEFAV